MSDIVSGVLKHTFGFLANKIRKEVAERLKDGDVTDEECRRLIVRELDDIKSKLDGLARKDLLSSLCFLQEGVNGLYRCFPQFLSGENTVESTERATQVEASSSRDRVASPNSPSSINEAAALINAIASFKIHSNEHFKSAIKSLELAREKATEAFCNQALSIEDRMQASQIRMMARILEKLEHPDASLSDCLQYLQQLHGRGAIREIFSVLIDGGIKSRFNRTKRLNIASNVQDMNQILFDFALKFTKLPQDGFDWPTISIAKGIYNPVSGVERLILINKLEESGMQLTSRCADFTFHNEIDPGFSVVNSKGEIVALLRYKGPIKIFKRSGESRTVFEVPTEEHASECYVAAMGIDGEDNIYVITAFRESRNSHSWSLKLFIVDENGSKKLETSLSFHIINYVFYPRVCIAIHKDGRVAILNNAEGILYIGKVCVEMNSYEIEKTLCLETSSQKLQFSDLNGTKIIVNGFRTVHIYTENGQLQRKIEIPDEHGDVQNVVINHVTKRILVKTYRVDRSSLLSFSESGELIDSSCLGSSEWILNAVLVSHPNGPVALLDGRKTILLQR